MIVHSCFRRSILSIKPSYLCLLAVHFAGDTVYFYVLNVSVLLIEWYGSLMTFCFGATGAAMCSWQELRIPAAVNWKTKFLPLMDPCLFDSSLLISAGFIFDLEICFSLMFMSDREHRDRDKGGLSTCSALRLIIFVLLYHLENFCSQA